jgi:hypothetical protein
MAASRHYQRLAWHPLFVADQAALTSR